MMIVITEYIMLLYMYKVFIYYINMTMLIYHVKKQEVDMVMSLL